MRLRFDTIAYYDKVGILVDIGVSKSSFIKLLLGLVELDLGHFFIFILIFIGHQYNFYLD